MCNSTPANEIILLFAAVVEGRRKNIERTMASVRNNTDRSAQRSIREVQQDFAETLGYDIWDL